MKNFTLLIFTVFTFCFGFSQNGGNTCATAVAVTPGSFTNTNYLASSVGEQGNDQPNNAAWFKFTPTSNGTIDVSACGSDSDTRLFIGTGTCGSLTTIAQNDDCDYGNGEYGSELLGVPVLANVTYYIEWDDRWDDWPFDWTLTLNAPPACGVPTAGMITSLLDTSIAFSWQAPMLGDPIDYNWEIVPQNNAPGVDVVVSGTALETNANSGTVLAPGIAYSLYVRTHCGTDDGYSTFSSPINFTTLLAPPPVNDLCSGAIFVEQEGSIANATAATPIAGTIANAAVTSYNVDCFSEAANYNVTKDDVWFKYTALTTDINITVTAGFFPVITLFSGADCGALTELSCINTTFGNAIGLYFSGLTLQEDYYFRVYHEGAALASNQTPEFVFKLWSNQELDTLGTPELEIEDHSFTYFPNPVKNELYLKAKSEIQYIGIYNMLGQEIYNHVPNSLSSEIQMQELPFGTYLLKVMINEKNHTVRIIKQN